MMIQSLPAKAQVLEVATMAAEAYKSYEKDRDEKAAQEKLAQAIERVRTEITELMIETQQVDVQACAQAIEIEFADFSRLEYGPKQELSSKYMHCLQKAHLMIISKPESVARRFVAPYQILNITTMFMRKSLNLVDSLPILAKQGLEVSALMESNWVRMPGALTLVSAAADGEVWGVNANHEVYRWTGSTWIMPNPAARLRKISAGSRSNIWGVASDGQVWKYNGSDWYRPSLEARLSQISAANDGTVWGVAGALGAFGETSGPVFKWTGSAFAPAAPGALLSQVSVGSSGNIWGVAADKTVWKFNGSSFFQPTPAARLEYVSVSSTSEVWGTNSNVFYFGTTNWGQPNEGARLHNISGASKTNVWGTTIDHAVFKRQFLPGAIFYSFYAGRI